MTTLTRRKLLATTAVLIMSGSPGLTDFVPPPPPPVVELAADNPVFGGKAAVAGQTIVIAGMIYVVRGMVGTQVIAFLYRRQATLLEFLVWPFPTPKPGPAEQEYLELALKLGNLPRFREEIRFRIADGRPVEWPADTRAMRTAIRFWSRRG
ncbi:hypothetical protein A3B35_01055 [Candidatus Kaiserbacteria bacterium RIFCSPLOWO2_01_FULL_54_24]|uniref:Uncharacterized protein n=1 Tax=Candidatus Kaiserbacteria bacterium RIFCSPLOWO2_01_FULL_54_24 TaxID=1798515 RepID=A0A1F6EVL6_9BACT|nr:MAG: hypothetical protein A3B35_01055 [Candidatus Kaiserbacteria bacterium RIFCSPLOWO2_01_FULL_54_24]